MGQIIRESHLKALSDKTGGLSEQEFMQKWDERLTRPTPAIAEPVTEAGKLHLQNVFRSERRWLNYATLEDCQRLFVGVAKQVVENRGKGVFVVDSGNVDVITGLCRWLLLDESGPYPPGKGFYLFGPYGTGKTLLLQVLAQILRMDKDERAFLITPCEHVAEKAESEGALGLNPYSGGHRCFDDLGEESLEVKNFGSVLAPMRKVISARYRQFQGAGTLTHFTSNHDPSDLERMYSGRVADRLAEMVTPIEVPGESRR